MKFKSWIVACSILITLQGWAQLDQYKYIVVPKRFDTFKSVNQHNTSVYIKYLLVGEGFNVVYDDAQPEELRINPCLGLRTVLNDISSLLATKVVIDLVDCQNNLVFTTQEGRSKKKDYKEAFAEAIEEAFRSFKGVRYSYQPKDEVKTAVEPRTPINLSPDEEAVKTNAPEPDIGAEEPLVVVTGSPEPITSPENQEELWYAQETNTGFQLVDSSPKIRMKLFHTSLDDVYIAEGEGITGVVFRDKDQWWLEHYDGTTKLRKRLNIRF